MADSLTTRGPDGCGLWLDDAHGVGLGHRRLAVIDLSERGQQPMHSSDGRIVLSYNGEIYNFPALRRELEASGRRFRGGSDTEVLVEALAQWGIDETLSRLNGIFAFAAWDRERGELTLARDALGVKPLYWMHHGGLFLFGSELKALRACRGWCPEIDRDAVAAFLRYSFRLHRCLIGGQRVSAVKTEADAQRCREDSRRIADYVNATKPTAVVLTQSRANRVWRIDGWEGNSRAIQASAAGFVDAIRASSSQVIVLADTPRLQLDPLDCVAKNPDFASLVCATEWQRAAPSGQFRDPLLVLANREASIALLDMTDSLCDSKRCNPLDENIKMLKYKNKYLLNPRYVDAIYPALEARLLSVLPGRRNPLDAQY